MILGAVSALLLVAAGLFWWQGRAATEAAAPLPPPEALETSEVPLEELPIADGEGLVGEALPEADEESREEKRFNRLDRNRDNIISRTEMLSPRVGAFKKLDTDRNNLLSFEEWAVATSNRFKSADANGDATLTRKEFEATRPKAAKKPQCRC
jgi:hypothetical protein